VPAIVVPEILAQVRFRARIDIGRTSGMKVISQLARHFWSQGALSDDQADYLVRQGFVTACDLDDYKEKHPRVRAAGDNPGQDALDILTDELVRRTAGPRGAGGGVKREGLSLEDLCERLRGEFDRRASDLSSLVDLAATFSLCPTWERAAVALRNASDEAFRLGLRNMVRARPASASGLWRALDPEPFEALVAGPALRGAAVQAFRALLQGQDPGRLGKYVWILKAQEVAAVGNLLTLRRRLLSALHRLYGGKYGG